MKTEHLLIIGAAAAVAYFGGFIPNTAPYTKKQAAAPATSGASAVPPTENTGTSWQTEAGHLLADLIGSGNSGQA